jgi:uncharacterized protein
MISRAAHFSVHETSMVVGCLARAHDGIRVAHVSDIHVGAFTPRARIRAAFAHINALAPDLVVLTGDYVTWSKAPVPLLAELFGGLSAPTFCVLGNHDHWVDPIGIRMQLENAGYTVLQNAFRTTKVRGADLHVIGVDDERTGHANVAQALSGVPASSSRIVLAHVPTTARNLPKDCGLACFSGHTHGGQVRVGGTLMNRAATALGHPYLRGKHEVLGNALYVSSGLAYGPGSILPRFRCPPEISLVTLRARIAYASASIDA